MNTKLLLAVVSAIILTAIVLWAVDVDVDGETKLPTISADMNYEEGNLPDIEVKGDFKMPSISPDVETEGGKLPDVDVETVDIDVDMEKHQIEVPTDVDVKTETKTFNIPTISVDSPEEDTVAEEDDL